jgi:hypothetical protein
MINREPAQLNTMSTHAQQKRMKGEREISQQFGTNKLY